MRRRTLLSALAVSAAPAWLITGCSGDSAGGSGGATDTLTLSVPYDNNSFDSAILQGGMELYWGPVYDTLLKRDQSGEIVGNAATTFEYNEDNTQLTVALREGMKFSDGNPVDAAAVKASMERMAAGSGASAGYLVSVATIEVVDDLTARIVLTEADPVLTTYLCGAAGVIASPAVFDDPDFSRVPVGSGPYVLAKSGTTQGVQYTFTKKDDHWDAASYPYETIVTKVLSDETARLNALSSGQLDFSTVTTASLPRAKAAGLAVTTTLDGWIGLMLADRAGTKLPPLADVRVRQAINYAFDREAIVTQLFGGIGKATSTIFDVGSEAYPADDPHYGYDPARSRELLAEAGYANGFDVTMPTSPGSTFMDPAVKQSLGDIGIRVTYEAMTSEQITPTLLDATYPLFFFGDESQTAYYDLKKMVLPGAVWNVFDSTDPTIERLAEEARLATDEATANRAYQEVGEYIVDQAWFVPITKAPGNMVTSSNTVFTPTPNEPAIRPRNFTRAA